VRHFQQLANAVLAPEHPGEWNEAMMELGALVCTPRMPACLTCPLASHCACANPFKASPLPRIARPVTEHRSVVRLWVRRGGRLLLHKGAPTARRLADLHELPSACELGLADEAARSGTLMLQRSRSITRYRIVETIHALAPDHPAADAAPVGGGTLHWFTTEELEQVALSGPHRRWVRELLARGN
jgi:A/G-specific adenine glycosylase